MFKNVTVRVKVIGAFFVVAIMVAAVSYFNISAIRGAQSSLSDVVANHLPRLDILHSMRIIVERIDKEMSLYQVQTNTTEAARQKEELKADLDLLASKDAEYMKLIDRITTTEKSDIAKDFSTVSDSRLLAVTAINEIITLKEQKASQAVLAQKAQLLGSIEDRLDDALNAAIDNDFVVITKQNVTIDARIQQTVVIASALSTLTGGAAIVIGIGIASSFARNVKKVKEGAARLAGGDFSSQIKLNTNDELGQLAASFNQMSSSLRASYLRLALEKERDETLLESMSEGMVALDENSNVVLINSVALRLFGLGSQQDAAGKPFNDLVHLFSQEGKELSPADVPTIILKTGIATNTIYGFLGKEKRKVLINIASSPIKLDDRIAGAIFVLRDVTKEREVDRMKTEFISLASHQLRTPLSAIKWFSEMLLNGDAGELKPEQLDFTKNIADSTNRMVDLVNSLLNISRIESGRIIVDPRPTDLKELITGIVNDLKAKTEERQQTLVISVHSDLPKINLDPRLISQVYLNLLTNAIKYTPKKGEISVFISKKGEDIISQVTDNGYGIPKDQQGRIFQKFFRAENVAKVETDGTGLGLYLIKAIVESSGGKIWFESEEGKGTSFWFTIPVSGMKPKEGEVTLDA